MAWDALTTVVPLTQNVDGPVITLPPGGTAHCQVKRTGVVTDLIIVHVFGILEDVPGERDVVPLFAFGLRALETSISFLMRGVFGFVPLITNGKQVPTGSVTGDFRYKKDGVDVG